MATDSLVDVYLAQRVTSSECPSLKWPRTMSCCLAPGVSRDFSGSSSSRTMRGIVGARGRCAGGDPLGDHPILGRIDGETDAPFVRNQAGRLGQQQAPARIVQHHAPCPGLPGEGGIVGQGVEPAQAEFEAFLAGEGAVAGARVATGLRQDRLDVIAKAPDERLIHADDGDFAAWPERSPAVATISAVPLPTGRATPPSMRTTCSLLDVS